MENKEFLSKEQCEALSELNYDGDYDFVYHATGELWERGKKDKKERFLPAPLKQQVLRWLSIQLDMPDLMIPVDDLAQNMLMDELILELKSKHLLL
jgi:hypothetical protein